MLNRHDAQLYPHRGRFGPKIFVTTAMHRPFETDTPSAATFLVPATTEQVIRLLRRAADDLKALEESSLRGGADNLHLVAASRAVHLALVELATLG